LTGVRNRTDLMNSASGDQPSGLIKCSGWAFF
jgi:hypothetical protein